jgi:diaminopimelate decarboxylase
MLWPLTTCRSPGGQLEIGGVSVVDLAERFGTPLYVYDEATIRTQCAAYRSAFQQVYPRVRIAYAGKAYLSAALLEIVRQEGLWLDVVSGGEIVMAQRSGFPLDRVIFHGNNKTPDELRLALDLGIGEVVVDNHHELDLLEGLTAGLSEPVDILLRINPGIDVHTHDYRKTGIVDSKFGLAIETGDAARATERALGIGALRLRGFHAHVGSQIFDVEPFGETVDVLMAFAAAMRARFALVPDQFSPGGGLGIAYEHDDPVAGIDAYARIVGHATRRGIERYAFPTPLLTVEPGRSIVGPAGVAIYRVGAIKEIPGVRRYVCVDGGMADNIRPALYGARYEAEVANRLGDARAVVTLAGKYCESGDVLIRDVEITEPAAGDLVAIPAAGAYSLAMASNYNLALRPAVVMVADGKARLVQRRETFDDLLRREVGIA